MPALERPSLVDYRNNGKKPKPTFSAAEMQRRQDGIRGWMAKAKVDACLFTSYHNINYLSDFLYCYFGRKYGLVITQKKTTSVTRRHRRRPAGAPHLRRQRHLHRLVEGKLLHGGARAW